MTRWLRFAVLAVLPGVLLAACAPLPVRLPGTAEQLAAQAARERLLGARRDWGFQARFAASDGHHGGSGSLDWRQNGDRYEFTLRAPITGKTVELAGGPGGAVLTGAGKTPVRGRDAGEVLNEEFGWEVPVADLAWWVRGLRAPDRPAILTFGANGLPSTLDQDGWHVDYRDWYAERSPPLPRKVYASRDPYTVRLSIEQWEGVGGTQP
ncbi:MAG: lipoprotein insertase outer membrane protein LolB [Rhodanobacteraceae bacterium]